MIDAQVERTYKLDGKTVAKNRKKRTEQKTDSLVDWFEKQVKTFGEREAEFKRSRLTVCKAYRRYNDLKESIDNRVTALQQKQQAQVEQETAKVQAQTALIKAQNEADIKITEAEARLKHGWVTVQGADATVVDASEK